MTVSGSLVTDYRSMDTLWAPGSKSEKPARRVRLARVRAVLADDDSRLRIAPVWSARKARNAVASWPAWAGVNERMLRGMAQRWDWREQMRMWEKLESTLGRSAQGGKEEGRHQNQPASRLEILLPSRAG
jgi:hypothetical protein